MSNQKIEFKTKNKTAILLLINPIKNMIIKVD